MAFTSQHNKNQITLLRVALALIFAVIAVGSGASPAVADTSAAEAPQLSPAGFLKPDGSLDTAALGQGSINLEGWDVSLDAQRGAVFAPAPAANSQSLLVPVTKEWYPFIGPSGTGIGGDSVWVLGVDGSGNLYAGGNFSTAGGVSANYIAKWNGSAWAALGTGTNAPVAALAFDTTDNVYVGGFFPNAGGVANTAGIAKWNGAAWSALGAGMDNLVQALAFDASGNLYAGGGFGSAGGVDFTFGIAMWNDSVWSMLDYGVNGTVNALAFDSSGNLYVGGSFTEVGFAGTPANRIAKWSGSAWSALGDGMDDEVLSLAVDGSDNVYAGGYFTTAGVVIDPGGIAMWNGANWSALGTGLNSWANDLVFDSTGDLYVGGPFSLAGGVSVNRIAKWNGVAFSPLGTGTNDIVYALAVNGSNHIFAGGPFTTAGGKAVNHVAVYEPTRPDLQISKSNDVANATTLGNSWQWSLTVSNTTAAAAVFADGDTILSDQMPDTNISYGMMVVGNITNVTTDTKISCDISAGLLTCKAVGADVTLGASTGTFTVSVPATPSAVGDFINPTGGSCSVDPDGKIIEGDETNNACSPNTVSVSVPDLKVAKSNDVGDAVNLGSSWTWALFATNTDTGSATFTDGQTILSDQLPTTNISYGAVSVGSVTNVTNSGNISCGISAGLLTCKASGAAVTLGASTGAFTASVTATPSATGTFTNPTGGSCTVDPDDKVIESDDTNNDCNPDSVTVSVIPTLIFADGFESGDLSAWSSATGTDIQLNGFSAAAICKLCVKSAAALVDAYGLKVRGAYKIPHYVTDETPSSEKRYRARFYIDIRGLKMGSKNTIRLFQAGAGKNQPFYLRLRKYGSKFQVRGFAKLDSGKIRATKWYTLPKKSVAVEIDWKAAVSKTKHNGYLKLWIDGSLKQTAGSLNNDTKKINSVRLGVTHPIKKAFKISGYFYLDEFYSDTSNYIGP